MSVEHKLAARMCPQPMDQTRRVRLSARTTSAAATARGAVRVTSDFRPSCMGISRILEVVEHSNPTNLASTSCSLTVFFCRLVFSRSYSSPKRMSMGWRILHPHQVSMCVCDMFVCVCLSLCLSVCLRMYMIYYCTQPSYAPMLRLSLTISVITSR